MPETLTDQRHTRIWQHTPPTCLGPFLFFSFLFFSQSSLPISRFATESNPRGWRWSPIKSKGRAAFIYGCVRPYQKPNAYGAQINDLSALIKTPSKSSKIVSLTGNVRLEDILHELLKHCSIYTPHHLDPNCRTQAPIRTYPIRERYEKDTWILINNSCRIGRGPELPTPDHQWRAGQDISKLYYQDLYPTRGCGKVAVR